MRLHRLLTVISMAVGLIAGAVRAQTVTEFDAVQAILNLGGSVTRNDKAPGKPVVAVNLAGTGATDVEL